MRYYQSKPILESSYYWYFLKINAFHTLGVGFPVTMHSNFADPPSATEVSLNNSVKFGGDVFSSGCAAMDSRVKGVLTVRWEKHLASPCWLLALAVYTPLSSPMTSLIFNEHLPSMSWIICSTKDKLWDDPQIESWCLGRFLWDPSGYYGIQAPKLWNMHIFLLKRTSRAARSIDQLPVKLNSEAFHLDDSACPLRKKNLTWIRSDWISSLLLRAQVTVGIGCPSTATSKMTVSPAPISWSVSSWVNFGAPLFGACSSLPAITSEAGSPRLVLSPTLSTAGNSWKTKVVSCLCKNCHRLNGLSRVSDFFVWTFRFTHQKTVLKKQMNAQETIWKKSNHYFFLSIPQPINKCQHPKPPQQIKVCDQWPRSISDS